jgi:hypothetical protein
MNVRDREMDSHIQYVYDVTSENDFPYVKAFSSFSPK